MRGTLLGLLVLAMTHSLLAADLVFTGARVLLPDGSLDSQKDVIVRDGKIVGVVDPGSHTGDVLQLAQGTVLSPGLIDLVSNIGCRQQLVENVKVFDIEASALEAVDPHHVDLRRALRAGVTSAMAMPDPRNIISGVAVSYRTLLGKDQRLDVWQPEAALVFSIGSAVWRSRANADPSSRSRTHQLLSQALQAPSQTGSRLTRFRQGELPGLIFSSDDMGAKAALRIFGNQKKLPILVHRFRNKDQALTRLLATGMGAAKMTVVTGPFELDSSAQSMRAVALLEQKGCRIAFVGNLPNSSELAPRLSAALAVRHGLSPKAARMAITTVAAEVAGIAKQVGSIRVGLAADLVLFSGDPLRLDSKVLGVYCRGEWVYHAE